MATITLTAATSGGQQTQAQFSLPDADLQRMATALQSAFPGMTNAQIMKAGLRRFLTQVNGIVKASERSQPTDIALT